MISAASMASATLFREQYPQVVTEHAEQGWCLIQVFAPGIGGYGAAKYYKLMFERER